MAGHDQDTQDELFFEKPPSPVLSNKMTRKYLLSKKLQKKSRVKLTDRFSESTSKRTNLNDTYNSLANTTLTVTTSDIAQLEKIESEEAKVGGPESQKNVFMDFEFKKPESPMSLKQAKKAQSGGFKTASGIELNLSDDRIKQSKRLFADILCPGESPETSRNNKYAFLSKRKSDDFEKHKSRDGCVEKQELVPAVTLSNPSQLLQQTNAGFQTASGKGVYISESAYSNAYKKFSDEPQSELQFGTFKCVVEEEMNLLSTQETNDLFSDFTISEDNDTTNEGEEECKGFTADAISHSKRLSEELIAIIDLFSKRRKLFNNKPEITKKASSGCKMNVLNSTENKNSMGFSCASGKKIRITDSALKSARNKFRKEFVEDKLDIDNDFQEPLFKHGANSFNCDKFFNNFSINNDKMCEDLDEPFTGFSNISIEESENKAKAAIRLLREFADFENTLLPNKTNCPLDLQNETLTSFSSNGGFMSAAGKHLTVSEAALKEAQNIWKSDDVLLKRTENVESSGFQTAAGHSLAVSKDALNKVRTIFQNIDDVPLKSASRNYVGSGCAGFQTAARNAFKLSKDSLDKARRLFDNIDKELPLSTTSPQKNVNTTPSFQRNDVGNECAGFQTAAGNAFKLSKNSLDKARRMFDNIDNELPLSTTSPQKDVNTTISLQQDDVGNGSAGFHTAAGNAFKLSKDSLDKARRLFDNIDSELPLSTASLQNSIKATSSFQRQTETETGDFVQNIQTELSLENSDISLDDNSLNSSSKLSASTSKVNRKKRLGISSCKQISIPKHKIEQAMRLFDEEKPAIMSPVRNNHPTIYNSTPLKNIQLSNMDSDLTPIKISSTKRVGHDVELDSVNDRIVTRECTKGNIDSWYKILENEKTVLQTKLKMLEEKEKALNLQKRLTACNRQENQKRRNGVLFTQKQNVRVPLKDFVKVETSAKKQLHVNPQNAELVHFNCTEECLPYIVTQDGACVVPNIHNHVGLSEIETAFKVMPGIDAKLLPNGWIRNHFRWIVWKLASYENFSSNIKDSLTLENVVQQLKYRYDREIDRAERPTLRKILEMDDAPQKRMVLCVADIFDLQNNQFELELTDGWYSIRTIVDEPLCRQVTQGKIRIGTKLITCGAELLNCEGCHPLQAADMIRLKICCNSTRRTRWYVKLGYQRTPEPFPVKLSSVFPSGGLIGCIKILIARVYPVKYMEKQNKLTVWRNRKAEQVRAQEWDNKGRLEMEKLKETITRDYEMSTRISKSAVPNFTPAEIKNIHCPETLFNLYQNNKDPEKFQEILSSSQRSSIVDYQSRLLFRQQQDISRKLEDSLSKHQIPKRDVTPVLQMLVVDVLDPNEKTCVFHIWRPSNDHVEVLKESSVFEAYNVLPKKNGDLCTMSRTRFQMRSKEWPNSQKYKRTLFSISQVVSRTHRPPFNEFDTVGVVVAISIDGCSQSLWLGDESGRLLFIKVFEGPKNCLLLDNLKTGQLVAVSNLVFCETKLDFGEAIANHLTVISCYPKAKHLEDGINLLNDQLPKNLKLMLAQCQEKISYYINKIDITRDYKTVFSTSLATTNSLLTSDIFDDSSDVLFSMIDVDRVK